MTTLESSCKGVGRLITILLLTVLTAAGDADEKSMSLFQDVEPIRLLAAQSGASALDRDGESLGNPFASALVELLSRPHLELAELLREITEITVLKSHGYQRPDVPIIDSTRMPKRQLLPHDGKESRLALVLVFSDYQASGSLHALPGADHDFQRVTAAFRQAGFATEALLNPSNLELNAALEKFAEISAKADFAAIYTTGHGGEDEKGIYLVPGNLATSEIKPIEVRLDRLAGTLKAKNVNLLFYGGCRRRRSPQT